jgi:hypothetical protein
MRVLGWNEALEQLLVAAGTKRFRWGRHDCCQFVAAAAAAVSGIDRRDRFPRYLSKASAEAILAECGGYAGLLTRAFGESVHQSRAAAGDVVLVDMGKNGLQPAVCMGLNCYAPGRVGLEHRPTASAVAAWLT